MNIHGDGPAIQRLDEAPSNDASAASTTLSALQRTLGHERLAPGDIASWVQGSVADGEAKNPAPKAVPAWQELELRRL